MEFAIPPLSASDCRRPLRHHHSPSQSSICLPPINGARSKERARESDGATQDSATPRGAGISFLAPVGYGYSVAGAPKSWSTLRPAVTSRSGLRLSRTGRSLTLGNVAFADLTTTLPLGEGSRQVLQMHRSWQVLHCMQLLICLTLSQGDVCMKTCKKAFVTRACGRFGFQPQHWVRPSRKGHATSCLQLGSEFPSSPIKIACPLVLALTRSPRRHVHASTCFACRVAFVVMPHIAWV
jgi:hypothetical protein